MRNVNTSGIIDNSIMNSGEIAGLRVNFIVYLQAKWECRGYLFQCIFLHACDKSKTFHWFTERRTKLHIM